ncbi:MAG: ribosome maturation factor RimM, partial [Spirochaetota bacterium]
EEGSQYREWEVVVPREYANPLSEGEYYITDLCQCSLIKNNETLGRIRSVCETGVSSLLEVEKNDGTLCLIPFLDKFIGQIKIEDKTVELRVDWILQ